MIAPDPNYRNGVFERSLKDLTDKHEFVDPTWVMRPFIDRWTMLVSFLSVNPRLPRPG